MDLKEMLLSQAEELKEVFKDSPKICTACDKVVFLMSGGSEEEADKLWPELKHDVE